MLLQEVREQLKIDAAAILLIDPDSGQMRYACSTGLYVGQAASIPFRGAVGTGAPRCTDA